MNWYKLYKIAEPIGEFSDLSGFQNSSKFTKHDKNILNSPKAIENIKKRWEKVGPWINVYFSPLNSPEMRYPSGNKIRSEIEALRDPNKITLIITDSQSHPTTAWMIAHRLSHSFFTTESRPAYGLFIKFFNDIFALYKTDKEYYPDGELHRYLVKNFRKEIFNKLFTMKSVRDLELNDFEEAFHELFAQYLMTGKVTLNNHLPNDMYLKYEALYNGRWINEFVNCKSLINPIEFSGIIRKFKNDIEVQFQKEINEAKGKILFDPI